MPIASHCASLISDTQTQRLLTELVSPLARAADIPENRMKIHIVKDDDFNAFVMGGEDIYVYTGLLKQIKTPSALQAVVAHELGHTLGGHMAQMSDRMSAESKRAMLIQALGIGLMVAGGNPSLGAGVLAGSSGVAQQSMLAFTRDEERIADNMGLDLMAQSGQDINGFITVFEQMQELTGAMESRINPNRINHPLTASRLKDVRERIATNFSDYRATSDVARSRTQEYELVRAKLIGYLDSPSVVFQHYPYSDKSDPALYARAIANMQSGDLDIARTGTNTLISRNPSNPYFYELLGDIEYQFGNYDASVHAYEHALELSGSAPQIETALALVLTHRGQPDDNARAVSLCKRSVLSEPAPLTYWVLARAYGDGSSGLASWALAEYYNLVGMDDLAVKHARLARKKLDKTAPEYIKSGDIIKSSK